MSWRINRARPMLLSWLLLLLSPLKLLLAATPMRDVVVLRVVDVEEVK